MKKLLIVVLVIMLVLAVTMPIAAKGPAPAQDGKAWGHEKNPRCRGNKMSWRRGQVTTCYG
jgi:hypothetical protein